MTKLLVAPQSQGVFFFFFFFYHRKKFMVKEKYLSRQNTSIMSAHPWCASLIMRAQPSLSRAHGLLYRDAMQRHAVMTERLCRTRIAWLRCNALPHCREIERYVVTWKTSCPGTLCRNVRYTLSGHNFRQLCHDIKFSVAM